MPTVKEIKRAAQIERRIGLHVAFRELLNEKYGRQLVVGDVLELPLADVINGCLSDDEGPVKMVVYAVGADRGSHNPAVGLMRLSKNTPDADPHNNYALAYGKTRLKRAKLIGSVELLVTDENVGVSEVGPIEDDVAENLD